MARFFPTSIEDIASAIQDERLQRQDGDIEAIETARRLVSEERTHRLKLADEQRAYVDTRDRRLSDVLDTEIFDRRSFCARGFWSRFNWLLTGR